jgi:hypothetical protein
MTIEEQEVLSRKNLTDAQNTLQDLSDDNFKAIILTAVKSDNTLCTISLGNVHELCFLSSVANFMKENALANLFTKHE